MTAFGIVVQSDAAHVISDGACIDASGRLVHMMSKATPLAHLNAVVGVRGVRALVGAIVDAIQASAVSYDDLHARIVSILLDALKPITPVWRRQFGPRIMDCEVIVAGWSERLDRPHAYLVGTSDTNAAFGLPAWTVVDIPGAFFAPRDPQISSDFACIQLEFSDAAAVDLVTRQRAMTAAPHSPRGIGAFVQLTTVRKEGITARILKRWPDAVGQRIAA